MRAAWPLTSPVRLLPPHRHGRTGGAPPSPSTGRIRHGVACRRAYHGPGLEAREGTNGAGLLERDRELASLHALIEDAAGGQGRMALIEGPAGIGKSRLLGEARDAADGRLRVLSARGSELER